MKKTVLASFWCALVILYSGLLFLSLFVKGNLLFELISMLLPYWLGLNLVLLIGIFLSWKIFLLKSVSFKFSTLTLIIASVFLTFRFINFTFFQIPVAVGITETQNKELKLAFLNKLFSNTNYSPIDQSLARLNPDLIGFSEIKNIDKSNISILSSYQCNLSKDARDGATIAFYSKFPCVLDNNAPLMQFVLPVKMQLGDSEYNVFVLHPYPPSNSNWLNQRNEELRTLATYIQSLNKNTILLGDFNLSPWSTFYQELASNLPNLKDTSLGEGVTFTWHGGVIRTQIDHIFVPNSAIIKTFKTEVIDGSDHNLIWTKISI
jgi:endonuclease/exonuclease/phosphatase (EEP) superfamily protein YafD